LRERRAIYNHVFFAGAIEAHPALQVDYPDHRITHNAVRLTDTHRELGNVAHPGGCGERAMRGPGEDKVTRLRFVVFSVFVHNNLRG
jgi:hypothetical protein